MKLNRQLAPSLTVQLRFRKLRKIWNMTYVRQKTTTLLFSYHISASVDIIQIVCFGKVDFSYHLSGKSSSLHSITVDLNRNKVKQ